VGDLLDHAPDHGGVLALHDLLEPPQAQPANAFLLAFAITAS
jgi:hypothetical protein